METLNNLTGQSTQGELMFSVGDSPASHSVSQEIRQGKEDERYLWPEMLRVIGEIKPTFIVGENVSGSWQLVDEICSDLEQQGFTPEPFGIEAASVGANNKRLRYWYCAYSNSVRLPRREKEPRYERAKQQLSGLLSSDPWSKVPRPGINRVGHGIPDRTHRIKGLGNAIVPQVAYEIFKAIEAISTPSPD